MKDYIFSLSAMKKTNSARRSALQKTLPDASKSLSNSSSENLEVKTPKKVDSNGTVEEIIPDTPERQFGKELQNNVIKTPSRGNSLEHKQITPLTTEKKKILLPRLHRCKSLSVFETIGDSSPQRKENTRKRRAVEELGSSTTKLLRTDPNSSVSRARVALFQDKKLEVKLNSLTLSTKSFYSNSDTKKDYGHFVYDISRQKSYRKSLGAHPSHPKRFCRRRYTINNGVSHGIKKRKAKRHSDPNVKNNLNSSLESIEDAQENALQVEDPEETWTPNQTNEETSSPEIDSTKRFFKTKKSNKRNCSAIVTINNNVKLRVAPDGKLALNQKNTNCVRRPNKRTKLMDISFDTTDLTVDEPELESTIEQNQVSNILKALEDDWADDDYDTMEVLTNRTFDHITPLKPVAVFNGITMSSTTELSNITSILNIGDISTSVSFDNINVDKNEIVKETNVPDPKYYPLFNKGYSSNKIFQEIGKKSTHKENLNWQLSVKRNGDDNQYQLDAGQINFGATQCMECGVIYQIGDPEDENAHLNYHNNKNTLKFPGWKTERVIMEDPFTLSRIILVEPGDPKQCWNKIKDVLEYVDRDLGLVHTKLSDYENKKVYLYIRDKIILGVLVAEQIETAHCMIPELLELDCCSAESTPAKCGINVVWTDMNHRKQGIATKLVDVLRAQFYYGYIMSLDDIAFSIPTPSGKLFAEKYTKTRNFKVYS